MKFKIAIAGFTAALFMAAVPMVAHHSFSAEYDNTKRLTLKGKFTSMDWVNPHSWVHFDVTNADGTVTNWAAETPPPNSLYRNGWRKNSIQPGEPVEVTGFAAKDGSPTMWSNGVTLTDKGIRLTFGSRPEAPDAPGAKGKGK